MGGQSGQPPYMGRQPDKPHYMGGPFSFSILTQPGYGPIGVLMTYDYHQYPHAN
jgi:hypothetical protein